METKELIAKLHKLAMSQSKPFCYGCYKLAPTGVCKSCGSDDLMRHVEGYGVEYGTEWILKDKILAELSPIDVTEAFEESLRECYGETTKLGWMEVDTVEAIKAYSPMDYDLAKSEHEYFLVEDGSAIELYGQIYEAWEIEKLVEDIKLEDEVA